MLVFLSLGFTYYSANNTASAAVGINRQINFQGKLVNPTGTNVTDGSYSIIFSIYTVAAAGSNIWTETQTVTVTNGIFQVNLGSVTALPGSVDFNTDNIYLGIKVGADAEMTPRVQFTAVPQAFNSEKLGGLDKTGFIQNTTVQQAASNFNISGAGVVGTSLTTPLLQSAAATALNITGNAASTWSTSAGNITLQAGSGTVSLGSTTTLSSTGALTITGGTTLALTSTGANAISLDSGTTGAVNIGVSANAKTVTIGNITTTSAVVVDCGTNGCSFGASATAHLTTLGSINSTSTTSLQSGTGGVNIGTGGIANTIQVGSTTGAVAQNINIGTNGTASSTNNVVIGSTIAGTTTIQNVGTISLNAGIIVGTATVQNLFNTVATTLNIGGAATTLSVGAASGTTTINGNLTVAANKNLTLPTGTGVITQGYTSGVTGNAQATTATNSNATATASTVNAANIALVGAANANVNANILNGINFNNVSPLANNSFTGLNFGTGYNSLLAYNGTSLISGTGLIQNAAIDPALSYTNLQKVGALSVGSLAAGFTTVAATVGGTGQSSYAIGDLLFASTTTALSRLADVATGSCLTSGGVGVAVSWGVCGAGVTLQTAYTAGAGGTIPAIKLDATRGELSIQDADTTIAGNLLSVRASNGAGLGATLFAVTSTGIATFKNTTNSTAAFVVRDNGNAPVLTVDTTNDYVGIGTITPAATLHVKVPSTAAYLFVEGASDTSNYSSLELLNTTGTSKWQFSNKSATGVDKSFEFDHYNGTSWITPFSITDTGNVGINMVNATANLQVAGTTLLKSTANSTTAFQIQNAAGDSIFTVDTSGTQVVLGKPGASGVTGKLVVNNATNANTVTVVSGTTSASYQLTLPTALSGVAGDCLKDTTGAGVLGLGSCGTGVTLQTAYTAGVGGTTPAIKLDATRGELSIQDANTTIAGNLLSVRASNGAGLGATLFSVNSTGQSTFMNSVNSTNALQVQNAAGSSLFNVSTSTLANLVSNPSAEASANGWVVKGTGTVTLDDTQFLYGKRSVKIVTGAVADNGGAYSVPLKASSQYSMSVWLRKDAGSTATINIGRQDNAIDVDCLAAQTVDTTWRQFTCTFTTGATINDTTNLYIKQSDTVTDNLFVDGLSLVAGATAQAFNAGGNNLQVEALTSNVTLNSTNSGELQSWQLNANPLPNLRNQGSSIVANGYVYLIGGANGASQSTVYYAKLNTDGSTGTWITNANVLPDTISGHSSVTANGYVYVIGGSNGGGRVATVYYAKLNADGSTGTWTTSANPLTLARVGQTSITANGYVYVMGGFTGSASSLVQYAKLNADGSTSTWTTSANPLTTPLYGHSSTTANGYVYLMGGFNGSLVTKVVYYAKLNADGSTSTWTTSASQMPNVREDAASGVVNGYAYVIGGINATTRQNTVYYVKLNADGSTGTWLTGANALPALRSDPGYAIANGYVYVLGGSDGTTNQSTVYYASTARIQLGGSLDLVGLSSANLAEGGGVGGSLTAGNTFIAGSLQVTDQANFLNSVSIANGLTVNSSIYVNVPNQAKISTAAIAALQVQGGTGGSSGAGDGGSGSVISLIAGAGGVASGADFGGGGGALTLQSGVGGVGSAAGGGGFGGNINIVAGNGGASSGSAGGGGNITLSAGAGGGAGGTAGSVIAKNAANSTTAFQVQNAAGNQILAVDTTANSIVVGKSSTINGAIVMQNSTNAFAVTLQSGATSANYSLTLPTALSGVAGDCLKDTTGAGVLGFGTCGAAGGSLQAAYTASIGGTTPEVKLDATRGSLNIQDADTSIAANLFTVNASNGAGIGTSIFTANSNGRVGVGTAAASYTLDVQGGDVNLSGSLRLAGTVAVGQGGGYLRINEFSQFASGIWLGTSVVRGQAGGVFLGSLGGDGQIALLPTSADQTRRITLNGGTGVLNTTGEIQSASANAFRMVQGSYGSFFRNDGSDTYLLLTAAADQYGSWNTLRPLRVNNVTGDVYLNGAIYARASDNFVGINTVTPGTALSVNGGNNINPIYPDGLVGTMLNSLISVTGNCCGATTTYNVPSGKTLYLTSYKLSGSGTCSGDIGTFYRPTTVGFNNLANPLLLVAGTAITVTAGATSTCSLLFAGLLVVPRVTALNNLMTATGTASPTITSYNVPSGKILYLTNYATIGPASCAANIGGFISPTPWSTTISPTSLATPLTLVGGTAITVTAPSNNTCNLNLDGYLTNDNGLGGP